MENHKFTLGEYQTKGGEKATVVFDWREHGIKDDYPLIGVIMRSNGRVEKDCWSESGECLNYNFLDYDDLVPLAPKTKRVPLERDDIPCGAELKNDCRRWAVNFVDFQGVKIGNELYHPFSTLMDLFEIRDPINPIWRPCWKEVPASE